MLNRPSPDFMYAVLEDQLPAKQVVALNVPKCRFFIAPQTVSSFEIQREISFGCSKQEKEAPKGNYLTHYVYSATACFVITLWKSVGADLGRSI